MTANICPQCGNIIQPWMHATCYNCVRNEQEFKRYGRRRPYKPTEPAQSNLRQPSKPPRKKRTRKPKPTQRPFPPPTKQTPKTTKPKPKPVKIHNLAAYRCGLNQFLQAIYTQPRLISDILSAQGLTRRQINALQRHKLHPFFTTLNHHLHRWLSSLLSKRQYNYIIRRFSLDGRPQPTMTQLSQALDQKPSKLEFLERITLIIMRTSSSRRRLEKIILLVAQTHLS